MAPTSFGLRPSSGSLQLSLAKVILIWKHSVRLCRAILGHAATPPHNNWWMNCVNVRMRGAMIKKNNYGMLLVCRYNDPYALLTAHVLYDVWVETGSSQHIYDAILVLEYALNISPSNFHIKLLLLRFYTILGQKHVDLRTERWLQFVMSSNICMQFFFFLLIVKTK